MLTAIIIVTIVGGAVLGLRYKEVFILAPAFLFPLLAVIGAGVARGAGIWPIALEMLVATTALQLGYVGGSAFAVARRSANRTVSVRTLYPLPTAARSGSAVSPSFGPVRRPER
jgi:hypothetical protein